jgi:cytochrome P450
MSSVAPDFADRPTFPAFDPLSQEFKRNPYPALEQARREQPVFYHPDLDIWVVTRYDDALRVQTDWETFSQRAAALTPAPAELSGRVSSNFFTRSLMASDPPSHTVSRKNVNRAFTRGRVAAMEPIISQIADELIDSFAGEDGCDIVNRFCHPLGVSVILGLLGLPRSDVRPFTQTAEDLMVLVSPRTEQELESDEEYTGPAKPMEHAEKVERWTRMADMRTYLAGEVESRIANPRDDLTSALVAARDETGKPVLEPELVVTHMIELITAGTDTTAQLIAHMIELFDRHPDQLAAVQAEPELWEGAVEEGLRRRGTNLGVFRRTTREVEIADTTIPAHALVWSLVGAAGHDTSRFEDPDTFDVRRANAAEHLSFGKGRHFCLGAPLARLEARLALRRLYERLPGLRLVPEQELFYKPVLKNFILERMDVVWDPPANAG